jgi:signal transduction histidine kinase
MMVETILRNLVTNAIKFSHEESIVEVKACKSDDHLEICIIDSGIGIKPNEIDNLFRIDSKVKQKGTNNEDGSGLGLILCKEFAEKNNGSISVESEFGKGSTFCFRLPLYQNS